MRPELPELPESLRKIPGLKIESAPAPSTLLDAVSTTGSPVLTLLSGPRGAGKTSWCLELYRAARAARLEVTGLICPPVFDGGRKMGIDVLDLCTRRRQRLAVRAREDDGDTKGYGWRFDEAAIAWGNAALQRIVASDLLILDEMGPLEFADEAGFMDAFAVIDDRRYRQAIVVVRPELLPRASAHWPRIERCFWCDG